MIHDIDMKEVKKYIVREIIQEDDKRLAKMLSHADLELRFWYDIHCNYKIQGLLTVYGVSCFDYLRDQLEYINLLLNEALRNHGISSTHLELQTNPYRVVDLDLWKKGHPSYKYVNM